MMNKEHDTVSKQSAELMCFIANNSGTQQDNHIIIVIYLPKISSNNE